MEKIEKLPPLLKFITSPACIVSKNLSLLDSNSSFDTYFGSDVYQDLKLLLSKKEIEKITEHFNNNSSKDHLVLEKIQLPSRREGIFDVFISDSAEPVKKTEGFLILLQETQARQFNKELSIEEHKLAMLGMLAGGISHDINNKLSVILGYAGLATKRSAGNNKLETDLFAITSAAHEATNLVQSLVKFCRSKNGEKTSIKPSILLKEIIRFGKAVLPVCIEIKADVNTVPSSIQIDPVAFYDLFILLLGEVVITLQSGGEVSISIQNHKNNDNVIPGKVKIVFTLSTKNEEDSIKPIFISKYGLQTPDQFNFLVRKLGCTVDTIATKENSRSCCVFEFIFDEEKQKETTSLYLKKMASDEEGSGHILLVEDEQMLARLQERALGRAGYTVSTACDGNEGYRIWQKEKNKIDLILTDMSMPRMSGFELAKLILQEDKNAIILLCTGYSDKVDEKTALEIGIKEYLSKPVSNSELLDSIQRCLMMAKK